LVGKDDEVEQRRGSAGRDSLDRRIGVPESNSILNRVWKGLRQNGAQQLEPPETGASRSSSRYARCSRLGGATKRNLIRLPR